VIWFVECGDRRANQKVAKLEELARKARYDVLLVNDGDIRVEPEYLRNVIAPLADPEVGMVTCLYRATAQSWAGRLEALGIATDFAPSVLVAPLMGVREFGLGSTLVFRRADLEAAGGFAAIADYLADDYQLAKRIRGLGRRIHLSRTVVSTALSAGGWRAAWRHQLRWHRTIRVSKGWGYLGLPATMATVWALTCAAAGAWAMAGGLMAARMAAGLITGWGVLRCPITVRLFPLIPLRDLLGAAIWVAGLFGSQVDWRGRTLKLRSDGRIVVAYDGTEKARDKGGRPPGE
jgi:ceramide glucosyltransferase